MKTGTGSSLTAASTPITGARLLRLLAVAAIAASAWRCAGGGGGSNGSGSSAAGSTSPTSPSGTSNSCSVRPFSPGGSVTGTFGSDDSKDCFGPNRGDQYSLTVTGQTDLEVVLTSSGISGFLGVYTSSGRVVILDSGSGTRRGKVYLPAGEYRVVVGRTDSRAGSYTLSSTPTTNGPCAFANNGTGPALYWNGTVPGASIAGTLDASDCGPDFNKNDAYFLTAVGGETVTVTVTASQNATFIAGRDEPGSPVVGQGPLTRNVARTFTFPAVSAGRLVFLVLSAGSPVPITYTLGVAAN